MESLRDKIGEMGPSGRLLLACAYAAAGDKKEAQKIAGQKSAALKDTPGKNINYDSNLRNSALSLLARTYIDPTGAEAAASAAALLKELKERGRYSTQEGGFSMIALGRYPAGSSGSPARRRSERSAKKRGASPPKASAVTQRRTTARRASIRPGASPISRRAR